MYELYKCNKESKTDYNAIDLSKDKNFRLSVRKISFLNILRCNHFIIDLYWFINTIGNCWIYSVYDGDKEVYHSYVTNKCYKFPFMKKEDIQIGNAIVDKEYRGYGIHTYIINKIVIDYLTNKTNNDVYALVESTNIIGKKVALNLGFVKTDEIIMKKILGVFKIYHTSSTAR